MLIFVTIIAVCYCFARRYKPPKYSIQKHSRSSLYMQKKSVAPRDVPWVVRLHNYTPIVRENENELCLWWWFRKTRIDGRRRFLLEISPDSFSRMPTNPFGRTGLAGRGKLALTGPNVITMTIIWSKLLGFMRIAYTKKGEHIYTGYIDHPMNTDNAWIEAEVYIFLDQDRARATPFIYEDRRPEPWLMPVINEFVYPYIDGLKLRDRAYFIPIDSAHEN